ncbi:IstB ATP binding domain-containing protein [Caballeronia calidae]|uniref:IstB ATP binding domain-containing protein n=1 Tax=Caballeronia calidae TaxID=1777139 RepID=A0A158ELF8_9BURK|nr:IstB ATP binding domain-containing protein [Caballeronia calidae]
METRLRGAEPTQNVENDACVSPEGDNIALISPPGKPLLRAMAGQTAIGVDARTMWRQYRQLKFCLPRGFLGSAIGHALIDAGYRVLFTRTSELVQKLQAARQSLQLPSALAKLDRFDLIILDDLSYARKDQAETSVLFELIAERYERRSLLITANQPFSGWNNVFPDPGMTVAAIDRLVHHSTIFEMNVESYRRRAASDKQNNRRRQSSSDKHQQGATTMTG